LAGIRASYLLPWAMDAVRVRAGTNGDVVDDVLGLTLEDFELGLAVPANETGTMNRSASILIQAGFNSRLAAIKAVGDTAASFTTSQELKRWLGSRTVAVWSAKPDWPTPETRQIWIEFANHYTPQQARTWAERRLSAKVIGTPRGLLLALRLLFGTATVGRSCCQRTQCLSAMSLWHSMSAESVSFPGRSPASLE